MRICFFDLDGTILTDSKTISYQTQLCLERLHKMGILIGYITSRTKRKIDEILSNLPCDFLASYDGALIECNLNGKSHIVLNECIDDVCAHKIIAQLSDMKNVDVFAYFEPYHILNGIVSCTGTSYYCHKEYNAKTSHLFSGCQRIRGRSKENVVGVVNFDNLDKFDGVTSYRENNDIVFENDKVNKGAAVIRILENYGLNKNDAVSFGDTDLDIDMFKQCKVSIAMGNATSEAKNSATFVTLTNNEDGVAHAINSKFLWGEYNE